MQKVLVVIDFQNDFIDGVLGTSEAVRIVPETVRKIKQYNRWGEPIFATLDTHYDNYLETAEGLLLPIPHCIYGTHGVDMQEEAQKYVRSDRIVRKESFGSCRLPAKIKDVLFPDGKRYTAEGKGKGLEIEVIGLCTDICVLSNAIILRAAFPEALILVDESCCAGTTPEKHEQALSIMESCQIFRAGKAENKQSRK